MRRKMRGKTRIALSAALILGAVFPASAATKHHRPPNGVTHDRRAIFNMAVPGGNSGGCPPSGGPSCSNAGPAPPDSW
jgi:hypothetical protein